MFGRKSKRTQKREAHQKALREGLIFWLPGGSTQINVYLDYCVIRCLGKTKMKVSQLLKLNKGAIIELDRKVGEAIDIYVNNNLVARGEVVVVDDKLGITMTEIVKSVAK